MEYAKRLSTDKALRADVAATFNPSLADRDFKRAAQVIQKYSYVPLKVATNAVPSAPVTLECIHELVEHGAIWKPDELGHLNSVRRILLGCEPSVTTELLRLLHKHNACEPQAVEDLLRHHE